jgi:predicted component of type VI protein secretion system
MLLALSVISDQGAALGPTAYKVFDERGGTIGRVNSNDWVLPDADKLVSSRHANVKFNGGEFYLEDASTNGTFLNGTQHRVAKEAPARLQDGDRIQIGDYQILVQLIDDSAPGVDAPEEESEELPLPPVIPLSTATMPFGPSGSPAARAAAAMRNNAQTMGPASQSAGANAFAQPFAQPLPPMAMPLPASPPEPTVNLTGKPEDLLLLLGLDPQRIDPTVYHQLGLIMRIVVQGLIDVLNSRAEVKSQFRMPMTNIRPVENNPLKFSMNADDALHNLFIKRNPGYLPPTEAFREGFQDIAFHQMAMFAGVRAAFNSMLASFHPDHLEKVYERKLKRTSFISFANRLRFWGMYRAQFDDIEKNMESHFQTMFGEEFAKAYSEQLQQLGAAARQGTR